MSFVVCGKITYMTITNIVNKIYFLTNTNSSSFPAADMLLSVNNALERVISLILQSDARWQFDDTNNTDLPIGTTGLVTDQQDYSIAVTQLKISRVEVKDEDGNWHLLSPIDQADIYDQSLTDFLKTSGQPKYYDKIGNSIFLYPKPDYTQSASLKVYFQRGPALYTSAEVTTGTKEPGFNSLYHELIPLWVAHDFAIAKGKQNAPQLRQEISVREASLVEDYALRNKDEALTLRARPYNFN